MPIPIAFLITDLDLGGAPLLLRTLAVGLRDTGRFLPQVTSLAPPGPVTDLLGADNIPTHSLHARSPAALPRALARWRSILLATRPRIVLSLLIHANFLATLGQAFYPRCLYLQSLHTLQPKPRWHWALQGILAPFARGLIAPSPEILQKISTFGPIPRGIVIPNGIDVPRFAAATPPPPAALPWPPDAAVVGYVGRFDPVKRLDLLLEAAALLRERNTSIGKRLHVALVGYGPQEAPLRRAAAALGIADRVHFVGATTTPEKWYKSFTLLCLPSEVEGFGLVVVEAQAAGIPVVAADASALRAVAAGGTRLVSELTPESLALVLQEVIAQSLPSATRARAQVQMAARYSQEIMVARYAEILEEFLRD